VTFWLVVQCLNQLRYRVPPQILYCTTILTQHLVPPNSEVLPTSCAMCTMGGHSKKETTHLPSPYNPHTRRTLQKFVHIP